jgi:alkaline phosphatase D
MKKVRNLTVFHLILIISTSVFGHSTAMESLVYSQAGDVTNDSVVLWGRCNQEQKSILKFKLFATTQEYGHIQKKTVKVSADTDYTHSVVFKGLKPNTHYYYQAKCKPLGENAGAKTSGMMSSFKTASDTHHADNVRFVWGADLGGQGWGRNPDLAITHVDGDLIQGGYVVFDSMSKTNPDFALFQGDMIYADGKIPPSKEIPADVGGGTWINDPAKDFVAITLDDFRANWKYNLGDEKMAHFLAKTPVYVQWDDHEVTNNWYPDEIMPEGAPYFGIAVNELAKNAKQALFEYNPIEGADLFRSVQHGKHMELFLLDERSFRGTNPDNYDPNGNEMLGQEQLTWLKDALKDSQATWKVISTHDPLSIVTGGEDDRDSWGQDDAAVLGREVQLAEILKFIQDHEIKNVVFLTSDVHFTAAISYDPALATFKDFNPFWEFVIGPIHAGAFGPGNLDESFGPQYEYLRAPGTEGIGENSPPPHLQSFGFVEISEEGALTVKLIDITGAVLFEKMMLPL